MTRIGESIEAKSSLVVAQGWEALGQGDRRGPPAKGYRVSFRGDRNVLKCIVVVVASFHKYMTKPLNCTL